MKSTNTLKKCKECYNDYEEPYADWMFPDTCDQCRYNLLKTYDRDYNDYGI